MKVDRFKYLLGLIVSLALMSLVGCGTDDADAGGGTGGDPVGGAFPRTVTHAMGDSEISAEPTRVAALTATLVDAAAVLGVDVVAMTSLGLGQDKVPDYLGEDGKAHVAEAEIVGELLEPSLEKVAAARPDLIISQTSRHEQIYDDLSKIAPTVMTDETGLGWREVLKLVGEATGTEKKANQLISEYEARAAKIGEAIKEKLGAAPTASPIRFTGGSTVRLYVANSFTGSVLEDAGFVLSDEEPTDEAGSRVDVSQENLMLLDADYLFIASKGDESTEQQEEAFQANPLWQRLEGETVSVRDDTWMTTNSYAAANSVLDDLEKQFGL